MFKIFKYYIKQLRKINKFIYWNFSDKIKFISITNVLVLALAVSFPSSTLLETFFSLSFLISLSYIIYSVFGILFSKIATVFIKRQLFLKKKLLLNEIDQMNGNEFEKLLYHLLKHQGFYVKSTPKTDDFGADLILRKRNDIIVVQAKHDKGNSGISTIKEVVGAARYYKANHKWVVTNRSFTKAAIAHAHKNKVTLLDRSNLLLLLNEYNALGKRRGINLKKYKGEILNQKK